MPVKFLSPSRCLLALLALLACCALVEQAGASRIRAMTSLLCAHTPIADAWRGIDVVGTFTMHTHTYGDLLKDAPEVRPSSR